MSSQITYVQSHKLSPLMTGTHLCILSLSAECAASVIQHLLSVATYQLHVQLAKLPGGLFTLDTISVSSRYDQLNRDLSRIYIIFHFIIFIQYIGVYFQVCL